MRGPDPFDVHQLGVHPLGVWQFGVHPLEYCPLGVHSLGVWPLGVLALGGEWAGERPDEVPALRSLGRQWHYFRVSTVIKPSAYGHGRGGGAWSVVSPPLG